MWLVDQAWGREPGWCESQPRDLRLRLIGHWFATSGSEVMR